MGLIDKVKKPLENYISFEDLICQLSQTNNEPLYSVVSYLIHFDIKSVGHYYIFADYKITPENAPWRIEGYLEEIQKILFMHNEEWIYEGAKSFEWLSDEFTRSKLLAHIRICPYYFFKKTELLLFPPLMEDELISFKNIDIPNTPLNDALKQDYLKSLGTNHIDKASHASDEELSEQLENSSNELKEAQAKIADLENQLAQAKAELADKPADNVIQSNTDIQNLKKAAIKQFNRSLATVLIDLDYQTKLRKGDIVNFIMPYMKELAFVLADEDKKKADNLTVSYNTLYDNHLQGLEFKQGRQSDDDKKKVNIDLLFKKQLPVTE